MKCLGRGCVCRSDTPQWALQSYSPPPDVQQVIHDCWLEKRTVSDAELEIIGAELDRLRDAATRALR